MEKVTIDEQNKKRIQRYIKLNKNLIYGNEQDIALLEQNSELTERLLAELFKSIMREAQVTRDGLRPKENDEFKEQIEDAFSKFDTIPKPETIRICEYGSR